MDDIIISRIWELYREWQLATIHGLVALGSMKLTSLEEEVDTYSECAGYIGYFCKTFKSDIIPQCKEDLIELEVIIECPD